MTVQAITAALSVMELTSSEKFLLIVLANYADADMKCWPSQARLAADTRMSIRTINANLKSLEMAGWLHRSHRTRRADGSRTSDMIHLNLHSAIIAPRTPTNMQFATEPTCNLRQNHSATIAHKPSIEPIIEPSGDKALAPRERAAPSPEERAKVGRMMAELAASMNSRHRQS
jgi:hypothetical protein